MDMVYVRNCSMNTYFQCTDVFILGILSLCACNPYTELMTACRFAIDTCAQSVQLCLMHVLMYIAVQCIKVINMISLSVNLFVICI